MATTGNSIDFGDKTTTPQLRRGDATASPIRGVCCMEDMPGPGPRTNAMEFIEITTTGRCKRFW